RPDRPGDVPVQRRSARLGRGRVPAADQPGAADGQGPELGPHAVRAADGRVLMRLWPFLTNRRRVNRSAARRGPRSESDAKVLRYAAERDVVRHQYEVFALIEQSRRGEITVDERGGLHYR